MLVTSLMGYDTHVSRGGLWMDPVLPESYGDLHITNAPMAGGRITIDIADSVPTVQGLPEGMVFHHGHRPWMTELVAASRPASKDSLRGTARQATFRLISLPQRAVRATRRRPGLAPSNGTPVRRL